MTENLLVEKEHLDTCDYIIGGWWGNKISWSDSKEFEEQAPWTKRSRFRIVGWKSTKPRKGQILGAEFEKSYMQFKIVSIERCGDPPDMFFGVVKIHKQRMKT